MRSLAFLLALSLFLPARASADTPPVFLRDWGGCGSGPGKFLNAPQGIAVGPNGTVYATDYNNSRVQMFDAEGTFLGQIGTGTASSADSDVVLPVDVAVNSTGQVYVLQLGQGRVSKFTSDGRFLSEFGSGQFQAPRGIALSPNGNVLVVDGGAGQVDEFGPNGNFLFHWGSPGFNPGEFYQAQDAAVDDSGNVFVTEYGNNRMQKFDSNGNYLAKWDATGMGAGQFNGPRGIAIDSSDNIYVVDSGNLRVQKFAHDGTYLSLFPAGFGSDPWSVALSPYGYIYVSDDAYCMVYTFGPATLAAPRTPPKTLSLRFVGPDPAVHDAALELDLPDAGAISLELVDSSGRLVRRLLDHQSLPAGPNHVLWDGTDDAQVREKPGVYFALLKSGSEVARAQVVLLP